VDGCNEEEAGDSIESGDVESAGNVGVKGVGLEEVLCEEGEGEVGGEGRYGAPEELVNERFGAGSQGSRTLVRVECR